MTFIELVTLLGVEHRLPGQHRHVSRGYVGIDCPDCSPGANKFKLGYNVAGKYATCWTCGKKDLAEALAKACGKPRAEIVPLCSGLSKLKLEEVARVTGRYNPPKWRALEDCPAHRKYLEGRGYNWKEVERLWTVGGIGGGGGRYAYRLFIPVFFNSQPASWTTRAIGGSNLRYDSSPPERERLELKSLLYGHDYVRGACVVVEGPLDVWKIGPGAVATFGTAFTRQQVLKISKIPVRAVCFDSEGPAQAAADRLCAMLEAFPGETHRVTLESGKDAGDASAEEVRELRERFLRR